jgi:hypothetical protein
MSNFPSKGVALRGIGAVYADRLAKRGSTSFWWPQTRRDSGRSTRASSRSDVEIGPRSRRWHGRFRLKKRAE